MGTRNIKNEKRNKQFAFRKKIYSIRKRRLQTRYTLIKICSSFSLYLRWRVCILYTKDVDKYQKHTQIYIYIYIYIFFLLLLALDDTVFCWSSKDCWWKNGPLRPEYQRIKEKGLLVQSCLEETKTFTRSSDKFVSLFYRKEMWNYHRKYDTEFKQKLIHIED